jgi:uncharacterized membrane protein (UPF0127 family)
MGATRRPPTIEGCHRVRAPPEPLGRLASFLSRYLRITIPERSWDAIPVLVAETPDQHAQGLSGASVVDLAAHVGMLFTFPCDTRTPVSMIGMSMPLDVAFLDAAGVVVSVAELDPVPDDRRADYRGHLPPHAFRHALELVAGGAARFGIEPGVVIDLGAR